MAGKKSCGSESTSGPARPYVWTDEEVRFLRQHRTDGAYLIAHVLGRSPGAVQEKARRLGVSLRVSPGDVCPMCGRHAVMAGTNAAKNGMCPVCWERRKTEAMRERAAEARAKSDYQAAKKRGQRARGR